ncbi:MAG: DUF2125 domain-containing protein, partial [Acetobacteraceae bacterium]
MGRRFGLVVLTVVALLVAGWSAWWYVLATRIDSGFVAWQSARRAEGWRIDVGAHHLGGWPLAARLDLSDVHLRGGAPALPIALAWDAAGLALEVAPLDPSTLTIAARGEQRIDLGGQALSLSGGSLIGRLPVDRPGPPWIIDIAAEAIHVRAAEGDAALVGHLGAHAVLDPGALAAGAALAVTLEAGRIELPRDRSWPLGERIEALAADATISGPVPPAGAPATRAHAWRRAGGTAALRSGTLRWGPLDATGSGHGGLDAALQPVAEGTARVTGWAQALDVLAAHHVISD